MELTDNIKKLYNQVLNDPNIITDKQKDIIKSAFKDYVMPPVEGTRTEQAIWGASMVAPELKVLAPVAGIVGNISGDFGKWLSKQGVGDDLVEKLVKLSDGLWKHDKPGTLIYGPKGDSEKAWFKSAGTQEHAVRVNKGNADLMDSLKQSGLLDIDNNTRTHGIISTATHDAGKQEVPLSILQREDAFPKGIYKNLSDIPTPKQVSELPDGDLKDYMTEVYRLNKQNLKFPFEWSNFTANDLIRMENHAGASPIVASRYGIPREYSIEGAKHHVDYNGEFGYPTKYVNPGELLPLSSRTSSIIDAADAIGFAGPDGLARYGKERVDLDTFLKRLSTKSGTRDVSSKDTQFDGQILQHYIDSGLAEKHFNELFNKNGDELRGLLSKKSK